MSSTRTSTRTRLLLASSLVAACGGGGDDGPGPFDREVEAADVSILYPLPARVDQLLAASDAGAFGPLAPEQLPGLPLPVPRDSSEASTYADLRLVSLRLDPCSARATCSPEVRAIFQPVVLHDGEPVALDAALHVFYGVPEAELLGFLEEILALKKAYGAGVDYGSTLAIQPVLAATGLDGDFAAGLERALLSHVGASRIERVTSMSHVFFDNDAWSFRVVDRRDGRFVESTIIDAEVTTQFANGSSALDDAIGGLFSSDETPSLPALAALAVQHRPEVLDADIAAGFAQAIAAHDPARHTSEDIDCVSCHVAEGARRAGVELYGLPPTGEFTSARSLAYRRDGKALTNVHAFSYLGAQVSIMRRTANESAVVADWFEAALTE